MNLLYCHHDRKHLAGNRQMNTLVIDVLVHKISYMFHMDGAIEPIVNIWPPIKLGKSTVDKFFLPLIPNSETSVASGDKLRISVPKSPEVPITFTVTEPSVVSPRRDLSAPVCPVCGSHLVPGDGIGRCINRTCMAQMTTTMLIFLSALGLTLNDSSKRIMDYLFVRGVLASPSYLFRLPAYELANPQSNELEIQMFLQYIHSIRGRTTVDQLLRGLRIGDTEFINSMRSLFIENHWNILNLLSFMDEKVMDRYTGIDWTAWKEFLSVLDNRQLLSELCFILYQ